jgi:hypothetical protein
VGNAAQAWEMGFAPLPPASAYVPSHARPPNHNPDTHTDNHNQ